MVRLAMDAVAADVRSGHLGAGRGRTAHGRGPPHLASTMTDLLQPPPLTRSEHWTSQQISPNRIGRKLSDMWADVAAERRSGNRLSRAVAESASMRTQTLNLIVVTDGDANHDDIAHLV